jgi:hypothetical protein
VNEDLVLVPEVEARRALRDYRIRLEVLAPYGSWTGCGALRVLRCKFSEGAGEREVELLAGYESYRP